MDVSLETVISSEQLGEICDEVWTTAVGLDLAEDPDAAAAGSSEGAYTAQVQVTGPWTGALLIELRQELATATAAGMFGLEPDDLESDDIADAVGELANIVGGNLKVRLPDDCKLSLPAVTLGERYEVLVPGSAVVCEARRRCGDEPLLIRLLQGLER